MRGVRLDPRDLRDLVDIFVDLHASTDEVARGVLKFHINDHETSDPADLDSLPDKIEHVRITDVLNLTLSLYPHVTLLSYNGHSQAAVTAADKVRQVLRAKELDRKRILLPIAIQMLIVFVSLVGSAAGALALRHKLSLDGPSWVYIIAAESLVYLVLMALGITKPAKGVPVVASQHGLRAFVTANYNMIMLALAALTLAATILLGFL